MDRAHTHTHTHIHYLLDIICKSDNTKVAAIFKFEYIHIRQI
jgi:hypothetical protein